VSYVFCLQILFGKNIDSPQELHRKNVLVAFRKALTEGIWKNYDLTCFNARGKQGQSYNSKIDFKTPVRNVSSVTLQNLEIPYLAYNVRNENSSNRFRIQIFKNTTRYFIDIVIPEKNIEAWNARTNPGVSFKKIVNEIKNHCKKTSMTKVYSEKKTIDKTRCTYWFGIKPKIYNDESSDNIEMESLTSNIDIDDDIDDLTSTLTI
jgi:hypothetical protein